MIHILIADDEMSRRRIRGFLDQEDDVEVVAECDVSGSVAAAIRDFAPDLVILGLRQVPDEGPRDLGGDLGNRAPPVIVVTPHEQYALLAFEMGAADFVLEPFDGPRLLAAIRRVLERLQVVRDRAVMDILSGLVGNLSQQQEQRKRIAIKADGGAYFLPIEHIDWIAAADNYVRIHARGKQHLVRSTMNSLESELDPSQFMRIHRSTIVRIERIKEVQRWTTGEYVLVLEDGTRLTSSRRYRARLQGLLSFTA